MSARQKELAKKNARKQSSSQRNITVQENDIADVVSVWTKIPVSKLTEKESKKLERLESELHKRVVGGGCYSRITCYQEKQSRT